MRSTAFLNDATREVVPGGGGRRSSDRDEAEVMRSQGREQHRNRGPIRVRRFTAVGLTALCALVASQPALGQAISWTSQFGTTGFDAIYALDDHEGDVFGVGEVEGALPGQSWAGSCDNVVRSYRGSGAVKWTRQFGTSGCDFSEAIAAAGGGRVYVGGTVEGALPGQEHSGSFDAYVRKYDEDGHELWTRQFGTDDFDTVAGAAPDNDGVYVVGQVCGALPNQQAVAPCDAYVRRYDAAGNELWTRQFAGAACCAMANEVDAQDGGVVVVGRVVGALPGQEAAGGRDVFVRKYDAAGNELWTRQFGTPRNDIAWGVDIEGGAIYIGGDVGGALPGQSFAGGPLDAFVRKYDSVGTELWTRQFGTSGFDRTIRVAAQGTSVFIVGRAGALPGQTFAGGATDPFVRAYDAHGNEGWTLQFGGAAEPEAATGLAIEDHGGDLFVSGGVGGALPRQTQVGYVDAFVMKILSG